MKNLLSITALLAASFCFAAGIASERTGMSYEATNQINETGYDQDTTMNRRQAPNRKRDMGDTSQVRPNRRTDTTNLKSMPADSPPGSMPKHRM